METLSGSHLRYRSPIVFAKDGTYFEPGKYVIYPVAPIEPDQPAPYELGETNIGGGINGGNAWVVKFDDVRRVRYKCRWPDILMSYLFASGNNLEFCHSEFQAFPGRPRY